MNEIRYLFKKYVADCWRHNNSVSLQLEVVWNYSEVLVQDSLNTYVLSHENP